MVRSPSSVVREDGKDGYRVIRMMRMVPDLNSQDVSIYDPLQEKLRMTPSETQASLQLSKGLHVIAASVGLRGTNRLKVLFSVVSCIISLLGLTLLSAFFQLLGSAEGTVFHRFMGVAEVD